MIVSSRKSVIPTYSTGRSVSSVFSYTRFPNFAEKERISQYFLQNLDSRLTITFNPGNSSRPSLSGFSISLWSNRQESGFSSTKSFNFVEASFRASLIFSILFSHKLISVQNTNFLSKFISFVPRKTRSRKKDIINGLSLNLPELARPDFYFFWKVYMYFQFLSRIKKSQVEPRNLSSSRFAYKLTDLSGLYFLGADIFNFEQYSLLFRFILNFRPQEVGKNFPSLSTPKILRQPFSHKIQSLVSHFRLST